MESIYNIDSNYFVYPTYINFNGRIHFFCPECYVMGEMKHFNGMTYGECRSCGKEYVLTKKEKR